MLFISIFIHIFIEALLFSDIFIFFYPNKCLNKKYFNCDDTINKDVL